MKTTDAVQNTCFVICAVSFVILASKIFFSGRATDQDAMIIAIGIMVIAMKKF